MMQKLRKQKGMTLRKVGDYLGVSESTVSQYENGKREASFETMLKLGELYDVSVDYLLRGPVWGGQREYPFGDPALTPGLLPIPRTVKKPLLGDIACGEPILAVENIEDMIDVPEDIRCDFVLRCKGDSMIGARINDGDVVYIRLQPEVENGEIAAVLLDGEDATLKRVYKAGGVITLQAENPAYPPIVILKDRKFSVLGKAVGFTSVIK